MIVTTDRGLRYSVEEVARGSFTICLLNPEAAPTHNPWTGRACVYRSKKDRVSALSLKVGEPFVMNGTTGEQLTSEWLREHGYAAHNRIVSIAP